MDGGAGEYKQLSSGPKTRVCYICGRQYGLHSFEIHLKQCKELWVAREALKDPKERKKLPEDPLTRRDSSSAASSPTKSKKSEGDDGGGGVDLDEINRISNEAYNSVALSTCAYCGRTFLPEKLAIHNKSCTADKPARRVDEKVRKGIATPQISDPGQRPSTSQQKAPKEDQDEISSPRQPNAMAGHIGGSAGRNIRSKAGRTFKEGGTSASHDRESIGSLNTPKPTDPKQKNEIIDYLQKKIATMEIVVGDLNESLADMKECLQLLLETE